MNKLTTLGIPLLTLLLAGAAPAVAESPYPSTQNEPTGQGSYQTDPGAGSDRIPGKGQVPMGTGTAFDELDTNVDGRLDGHELNAYGSSNAGPDNSYELEIGDRNLKRLDTNQDMGVSREEFEEARRKQKQNSDR